MARYFPLRPIVESVHPICYFTLHGRHQALYIREYNHVKTPHAIHQTTKIPPKDVRERERERRGHSES